MAKFDAGTAVESLEFDFTAYGGNEGVIPEPSSGAVKAYFRAGKALAKDMRKFKGIADQIGDTEDLTDEEITERMSMIEEAEEGVDELQGKQRHMLADLCGGAITVDDLDRLPFRVFQAFNQWLLGEISPKRTTPGSKA